MHANAVAHGNGVRQSDGANAFAVAITVANFRSVTCLFNGNAESDAN
ncbi:MAG: hypothetical protein ACJ789_14030 [Thermomicrobiales bacterium]